MHKFDLKDIKVINGNTRFLQLTVDDYPDYRDPKITEDLEERKTGQLDLFIEELEKKYAKDINRIYSYMQLVSEGAHVPGAKYHILKRDKHDKCADFEFKSGDIRIYGFQAENGKIIAAGGYKNSQPKDIRKFRLLKNQYLKSLSK